MDVPDDENLESSSKSWFSLSAWSPTLTLLSTFSVLVTLIWGGIVHAAGASLACPDWPLCFGEVFPKMNLMIFLEHGHRNVAGTSGLLVMITGLAYWFDLRRTPLERKTIGFTVLLIIFQSILGGITVITRLPAWVSTLHFGFGHLTLGALVFLSWKLYSFRESSEGGTSASTGPFLRKYAFGVLVLLFGQMMLGAWLRHFGFPTGSPGAFREFLCADFPLCDPTWLESMAEAYHVWYWAHRSGAVVVSLAIVVLAFLLRSRKTRLRYPYHLSLLASLGVFVQVLLGAFSVRSFLSISAVTLHLAGGIFLFVCMILINLELSGSTVLSRWKGESV